MTANCTARMSCVRDVQLGGPVTGQELRDIRKSLGLTQAALAERLAVTTTTLARWERNELPMRESMARFVRLLYQVERDQKEV